MNDYGVSKKPSKDDALKLRNYTLRKLIIVARNLNGRSPFKIDPKKIDDIIIKHIHCSKRTAYEYRIALLEICGEFFW